MRSLVPPPICLSLGPSSTTASVASTPSCGSLYLFLRLERNVNFLVNSAAFFFLWVLCAHNPKQEVGNMYPSFARGLWAPQLGLNQWYKQLFFSGLDYSEEFRCASFSFFQNHFFNFLTKPLGMRWCSAHLLIVDQLLACKVSPLCGLFQELDFQVFTSVPLFPGPKYSIEIKCAPFFSSFLRDDYLFGTHPRPPPPLRPLAGDL